MSPYPVGGSVRYPSVRAGHGSVRCATEDADLTTHFARGAVPYRLQALRGKLCGRRIHAGRQAERQHSAPTDGTLGQPLHRKLLCRDRQQSKVRLGRILVVPCLAVPSNGLTHLIATPGRDEQELPEFLNSADRLNLPALKAT